MSDLATKANVIKAEAKLYWIVDALNDGHSLDKLDQESIKEAHQCLKQALGYDQ